MLTRELRAPAPVKAKRQQRHPHGEKKVAENTKWHALISAWLGEAFDAMDASLYFVALVPAMSELLGTHNDTLIGQYGSFVLAIFMMGWFVGAVAFGTLADRIGRRKTMLLTILIYSAATGLCALCHDWIQLSVCRFIVGCGIGGEICLGTVVVAEFWKGRSRLWATCLLESSFNAGLLLSAGINAALGVYGWRWMFLVGVVPALATIYIRSKLKESDAFQEVSSHREQARSTEVKVAKTIDSAVLKSPFAQLMAPDMKPRLIVVASLCASAIVGFWACVSWLPAWTNQLTGTVAVAERSFVTTLFSVGGLIGCFLTPLVLDRIGRANTLKISFLGALVVALTMFLSVKTYGTPLLAWAFALGIFTNMQFTALQIYIPEVFPTSMLATAAGICFGAGRIFSAALALCGAQLIGMYGGSYGMASATLSTVYVVGVIGAFFVMETQGSVAGTKNLKGLVPAEA